MTNDTLTRLELYKLVWAEPMTALAKKYNITDTGLRKICIRMNIPLPKAGHWQKIKAGKNVKIIELPSPESSGEVILQELEKLETSKEYPWSKLQREIENDPRVELTVPGKLHQPDKLITEAKMVLTATENKSWKFKGMVESKRGILDITVQPKNITRALSVMDTFIKLLKARGHEIEIQYDSTYAMIRGVKEKFQLKEKSKIVEIPGKYGPTREFVPTVILSIIYAGIYYSDSPDGTRKLETKLSAIVARMESRVNELHESWRQNRIRVENEKEIARLKEEQAQLKKNELKLFKALLNRSLRWEQVKVLRNFIDNMEAHEANENQVTDEFTNWLLWARKKADWYDPEVEGPDELMNEVDKESLTFSNQ